MVGNPNDFAVDAADDKVPNPIAASASTSATPEGNVPGMPRPDSPIDGSDVDSSIPKTLVSTSSLVPVNNSEQILKGDLCRGRVVGLLPSGVVVDIGRKTEGLIAADEFEKSSDIPSLGKEIDVIFQGGGCLAGYASVSHQSARRLALWKNLEQAHRDNSPVTAKVVAEVQGGLSVDIGLSAFLPRSQIDLQPPPKIEVLVGSEFPVQIVKLSRTRGSVVVSRRALLEEEIRRRKTKKLSEISLGSIVNGTVKNTTRHGVFVDLGGVDAFLHTADLSYSWVDRPSDVVKIGTAISATVIKFEPEQEQIVLSLKALEPDPWEDLKSRYTVGDCVSGKVVRVVDFGAFLEIEKGLEGLLHLSETSWSRRPLHSARKFKIGQSVECAILKIDSTKRRLSLSVKALIPDPWANIIHAYPVGTVVEGKVLSMAPYGVFIELEEGVEGLVHITDLSRDRRVQHPKEILKKGQGVLVVVLRIERESRRLSLGMKQLEPDPWDDFSASHYVGDVIEARVLYRTSVGVFVELIPGLEALCDWMELEDGDRGKDKGGLTIGRAYNFRILDLNDLQQRIRLSRRGIARQQEITLASKVASVPEVKSVENKKKSLSRESPKSKKTRRRKKPATKRAQPGWAGADSGDSEVGSDQPSDDTNATTKNTSTCVPSEAEGADAKNPKPRARATKSSQEKELAGANKEYFFSRDK